MATQLTPDELDVFLAKFGTTARFLCLAARQAVIKVFPDAIETAEGKELGYGFDRAYKGLVFAISINKQSVNLGIAGGATLSDPGGLLKGTGKVHRHIQILDAAALSDPALTELLTRAVALKRLSYTP